MMQYWLVLTHPSRSLALHLSRRFFLCSIPCARISVAVGLIGLHDKHHSLAIMLAYTQSHTPTPHPQSWPHKATPPMFVPHNLENQSFSTSYEPSLHYLLCHVCVTPGQSAWLFGPGSHLESKVTTEFTIFAE